MTVEASNFFTTVEPSCSAVNEDNAPFSLPMGDRLASMITIFFFQKLTVPFVMISIASIQVSEGLWGGFDLTINNL